MSRENRPLTPEWLRRLRDSHAREGAEKGVERRKAAVELARRLGLKIAANTASISPHP